MIKKNNKGILFIAHGSPREKANLEFIEFSKKIQEDNQDSIIQPAFLECFEPNISQGVDLLIEKNISNILVLPYFLGNGKHTTKDIPEIISQKKKEHVNIQFDFEKPIGLHPMMHDLVGKIITNS